MKKEVSGPSTIFSTTRSWRESFSSHVALSGQQQFVVFFNLLYNKASTLTPGHIDVVDKLQRPERLRPWQSGQRAGHGAGRWGGVGRLHWGQVRPRTTGLLPHFYPFKNYTKMIFFFLFFSQVPQSSVCVTESRCPSQPPVWTSPPPCFHFITPCVLKVICFFKDVVASSWSHVSHL